MAVLCEIASDGTVERGWTARIGPFTAKIDGIPTSLAGLTPTAEIRGRSQSNYINTVGDVVVDPDQGANPGQWSLDPDPTDFTYALSPYSIRLKVVDGAGKVAYFPSAFHSATILVGQP